jgi:hypothetical protein
LVVKRSKHKIRSKEHTTLNQINFIPLFTFLSVFTTRFPCAKIDIMPKTQATKTTQAIKTSVFALTPASAVGGILNYTKAEHSKIYKSGIRSISDTPFNCDSEGLFQFLREVEDRAIEMGWFDGVLDIAVDVLSHGEEEKDTDEEKEDEVVYSNLIANYGTITLDQVIAHEKYYIWTDTRAAQDTYMLYQCLMSSLAPDAKKRIMLWSDQYQIEVQGTKFSSGVALLKIIIRESHLDTNATTNSLRTKLSNLDNYMRSVDFDIGKFNQQVKLLVQSLAARKQTTSDLLINLFKGYGAINDEEFKTWLQRKSESHDEGENELTPDSLMLAAKNKYDIMVERGTWNSPTNEEKFVALEAKLTKNFKELKKQTFNSPNIKSNIKSSNLSKSKHKKPTQKAKDSGDTSHPSSWATPKDGDKKSADYKGRTWYWCGKDTGGKCEKWRAHDPKTCQGLALLKPTPGTSAGNNKGKSDNKKLKVARAYLAKLEKRIADTKDASSDEEMEE